MLDPEIPAAFDRLVQGFVGPGALPAGGAGGVTAIAIGVALGMKVVRMSPGSAGSSTVADLNEVLTRLMPEFAADCETFAELLAAFRQPRERPDRTEAIRNGWRAATEAPVRVARCAMAADRLLDGCEAAVKPDLLGDLHAARRLIRAGNEIAVHNAEENARHLDPAVAERVLAGLRDPDARE